jgi:ribosomal protein L21E
MKTGDKVLVVLPPMARKHHKALHRKYGTVEIVKADCVHVSLVSGGTAVVNPEWLRKAGA